MPLPSIAINGILRLIPPELIPPPELKLGIFHEIYDALEEEELSSEPLSLKEAQDFLAFLFCMGNYSAEHKENLLSILGLYRDRPNLLTQQEILCAFKIELLIKHCTELHIENTWVQENLQKILRVYASHPVSHFLPYLATTESGQDSALFLLLQLLEKSYRASRCYDKFSELFDFLKEKTSPSDLPLAEARLFFQYFSLARKIKETLFEDRDSVLEQLSLDFLSTLPTEEEVEAQQEATQLQVRALPYAIGAVKWKSAASSLYKKNYMGPTRPPLESKEYATLLSATLLKMQTLAKRYDFHTSRNRARFLIKKKLSTIELKFLKEAIIPYFKKQAGPAFARHKEKAFSLLMQKLQPQLDSIFETLFLNSGEWETQALQLSASSFSRVMDCCLFPLFLAPLDEKDLQSFLLRSEEEEKGEETTFVTLKKREDFYVAFADILYNHLNKQGFIIPYAEDPRLQGGTPFLSLHTESLLHNPDSLLQLMKEDTSLWFHLPEALQRDVGFLTQHVASLQEVLNGLSLQERERVLERHLVAIWRLIELNPDCLSDFSSGSLPGVPSFAGEEDRGFSEAWWNQQVKNYQALAKEHFALRASIRPLNKGFLETSHYFSFVRDKRIWVRRIDHYSEEGILAQMGQMQALNVLMYSPRLTRQQIIKYGQTLSINLMNSLIRYRKEKGPLEDPGAPKSRLLNSFEQALLPLLRLRPEEISPVPEGSVLTEEMLQAKPLADLEDYWNRTNAQQRKEDAKLALLEEGLTAEQRRVLQLVSEESDWLSAYFTYERHSPYSAFEDWGQVWWQLQETMKQFAALLQTTAYLGLRLGVLSLQASLFCAYSLTLLALATTLVYLYGAGIGLIDISSSYFCLAYFLWMSFAWMWSLFDYRNYSIWNEVYLPAMGLLWPITYSLLLFFLVVPDSALLIIGGILGILFLGSSFFWMLVDVLEHWRAANLNRDSFLDYCYRIVAPLPIILTMAWLADALFFGGLVIAGILACALLVRISDKVENAYLYVDNALAGFISESFYVVPILNYIASYALETWKIVHNREWNILSPWFSRGYETLAYKRALAPENVDLATACENSIDRLMFMKEDPVAQKKGAVLYALWELIQKDREKENAQPEEAGEAIPAPSTLEELLLKKYPVEGCPDLSFWQVANSKRSSSKDWNPSVEEKHALEGKSWGLSFFDSQTHTARSLFQAGMSEAPVVEEKACVV